MGEGLNTEFRKVLSSLVMKYSNCKLSFLYGCCCCSLLGCSSKHFFPPPVLFQLCEFVLELQAVCIRAQPFTVQSRHLLKLKQRNKNTTYWFFCEYYQSVLFPNEDFCFCCFGEHLSFCLSMIAKLLVMVILTHTFQTMRYSLHNVKVLFACFIQMHAADRSER